jgi:hypothetical protein
VVAVLFVVEDYVGEDKVGDVVKLDSSDNDLFTTWILRMFYSMFQYVGRGGTVSFNAPDDTGATRTFNFKRDTGDWGCHLFNTFKCGSGVRVRYGMSSTPASRTDYRLLQEVYVDDNPRLLIDESRGFVMVESVVVFGADMTICEVGLSLYTVLYCTGSGAVGCGEFLLDRTVFSPCRTIPASTPYTVRYRVQL